jgi:hypothetical protein
MKIASQSSSAQITHKEESLNPSLDLSQITQTSEKKVLGRAHKGFRKSVFIGGTSSFQTGKGGSFYTIPQKLAVGN